MKRVDIDKLLASLILTFFAGAIGSLFTIPSINTWYVTLKKPVINPPNFVFGPVWTVLYIFMGAAFYFVWTRHGRKEQKDKAIFLFLIQLVLNTLWSIIFFGLHSPIFAFAEITILWIVLELTTVNFFTLSKKSGWLMVPYLVWVSFAMILNLSIALMNP